MLLLVRTVVQRARRRLGLGDRRSSVVRGRRSRCWPRSSRSSGARSTRWSGSGSCAPAHARARQPRRDGDGRLLLRLPVHRARCTSSSCWAGRRWRPRWRSCPAGLLVAFGSTRVGPLVNRFGTAPLIAAAFVAFAAGYALFLRADARPDLHHDDPADDAAARHRLRARLPSLNMQGTTGVADHEQGLASGLINTSFQVGGAITLAIVSRGRSATAPAAGAQAFLHDSHTAVGVVTGVAALGLVSALSGLACAGAPRWRPRRSAPDVPTPLLPPRLPARSRAPPVTRPGRPVGRTPRLVCAMAERRIAVVRPGVQLVPPRRLHRGRGLVAADRRDPRGRAHRRRAGRDRGAERAGIARGLATAEVFAHFCEATGITEIDAVATSAIRDADQRATSSSTAPRCPSACSARRRRRATATWPRSTPPPWPTARCSTSAAARCSWSASPSRHARELQSWPLGAVRMTERFGLGEGTRPRSSSRRCASTSPTRAERRAVAAEGRRADRRHRRHGAQPGRRRAARRAASRSSACRASWSSARRSRARRAAGRAARRPTAPRCRGSSTPAPTSSSPAPRWCEAVLEVGGFPALEATEAGLREGVFFGRHLDGDPPLFDDVRRASVLNLAAQYHVDPAHTEHVARLALGLFDDLAAAGLHPGDARERELLWAAARAARHRHERRLRRPSQALALPDVELGPARASTSARSRSSARPCASTARACRRWGRSTPLLREGDARDPGPLRAAAAPGRGPGAQPRPARPRGARPRRERRRSVQLALQADGDVRVARWAASRETDLFAARSSAS